MANAIVSIRIPQTLAEELEKIARENHYMDISELVRSLLRSKWLQEKDPYAYQIKKLRDEIREKVKAGADLKANERLIEELEKIKEAIKGEQNK